MNNINLEDDIKFEPFNLPIENNINEYIPKNKFITLEPVMSHLTLLPFNFNNGISNDFFLNSFKLNPLNFK